MLGSLFEIFVLIVAKSVVRLFIFDCVIFAVAFISASTIELSAIFALVTAPSAILTSVIAPVSISPVPKGPTLAPISSLAQAQTPEEYLAVRAVVSKI